MWGWLEALVKGIVQPLVDSWQQYQHGRSAQQRDDLQATVTQEREIHDALEADRADRKPIDLDLVRREIERRAADHDGSKGQ